MNNSIQEIISKITSGMIFDSHYIVTQLIKHHSNIYLEFAGTIHAKSGLTEAVHSQIGKRIDSFSGTIITKLPEKSWSENIRGNSSYCTAWKKL